MDSELVSYWSGNSGWISGSPGGLSDSTELPNATEKGEESMAR